LVALPHHRRIVRRGEVGPDIARATFLMTPDAGSAENERTVFGHG
jgi:hypothetical protein